MKKSMILFLLVISICFTAFAAVNNEEMLEFSYQINSEPTVNVQYKDGDFVIINLIPGDILAISLPANATTGYQWVLEEELHSRYVELISNSYIAPETNLLGAGGTSVWTFKAVNEGIVTAELEYLRTWETDVAPIYTLMLQLQTKNEKEAK
ncbi:MAG TPA: protease inhibitor I42 family protein [Thermotogota bacterium]|nr:protease inhibitor I42 family protein [Thermotogota bacterium]HPJ88536.1 protease inhibitor I42 family protein [Thermotogota bacterium]HPR96470.1 protease inhibitor I42 family protein [Thermotogota bacterium]